MTGFTFPSRIRCLVIIVAVRQPFQVLVFPFRRSAHDLRYAIFCRRDLGTWQGLAGGGEGDEAPEDAARREAFEEAGISRDSPLLRLDTVGKIAVEHFADRVHWDRGLRTIPEYGFAVAVTSESLQLSAEHSEYAWLDVDAALKRLKWQTNRAVLRELHDRLTGADFTA